MASNGRKRNAAPSGGVASKKSNKDSKPVEVFLRLAPYTGEDATLFVVNEDRVRCVAPAGLLQRSGQPYPETEYNFSMVFDNRDTQGELFESTGLDLVEDVVKGRNALLFAYGVTGSGKTYTMTGSATAVGLLPRVLDVLFNSLDNRTMKCVFAPTGRNGFVVRKEEEAAEVRRQMETEDQDESTEALPRHAELKKVRGVRYDHASSVFIQYYELYNDFAYDLLDYTPDGQMPPKKPLHVDASNMVYVEGAYEVEVDSADEALRVFYHGEEKRRTSDTLLNNQSSRSHAIFSIRVVQAPLNGSYPNENPSSVVVSQLALVDLAGSERAKRTQNVGERLQEAGKINQSLMVLRQCLDKLRRNQASTLQESVPYRDSKLTYLFKNYFEGHGRVRMIVCANPRPADFEENLAVMQFAESAQAVQVNQGENRLLGDDAQFSVPVPHRFYMKWASEVDGCLREHEQQTEAAGDDFLALPQIPNDFSEGDDCAELIASLRSAYEQRIIRRNELRDELARKDSEAMAAVRGVVCLCEWRGQEIESLRNELDEERAENGRIRANYKQLQRENESLRRRLSAYETHDQEANAQTEKLRRSRKEMTEELRRQQRTLQQVTAIMEGSPSVATLRSRFDRDESVPRSEATNSTVKSSQRNQMTSSLTQMNATSTTTSGSEFGRGRNPAHINPKYDHRRSKSATTRTGRVLGHEPQFFVPDGTVMQAALPRGTHKTTRPEARQLKKSTDYILTHQETDGQGNLTTQIVKGEPSTLI